MWRYEKRERYPPILGTLFSAEFFRAELCGDFNLVRSFRIGRAGLRVHQILSFFKIRARSDLVRPIRNERTRLKAPQSSAAKSSAEDTLPGRVREGLSNGRSRFNLSRCLLGMAQGQYYLCFEIRTNINRTNLGRPI